MKHCVIQSALQRSNTSQFKIWGKMIKVCVCLSVCVYTVWACVFSCVHQDSTRGFRQDSSRCLILWHWWEGFLKKKFFSQSRIFFYRWRVKSVFIRAGAKENVFMDNITGRDERTYRGRVRQWTWLQMEGLALKVIILKISVPVDLETPVVTGGWASAP